MSRRLLVAVFAILALAGLTACGDDGGGINETTTTAEQTTTTDEDSGGKDDEDEDEDEDGGGSLPTGQSPGNLGNDSDLDALADLCFDGDMAGCDLLYCGSEAGSSYEAYGDTCGGRQDTGTGDLCTDVFDFDLPSGQSPGNLGNDDDLDALADECFDGRLRSCDDLFSDSPVGSDYEVYGVTCGGRLPVATADLLIENATSVVDGPCRTYYGNAT